MSKILQWLIAAELFLRVIGNRLTPASLAYAKLLDLKATPWDWLTVLAGGSPENMAAVRDAALDDMQHRRGE